MSFGFTEILVIGTVALLVFGGDLPDVMRSVGRAYGKFRQGLHDMSKPVREEIRRVREDIPNVADAARAAVAPPTKDAGAPSTPTAYDVGTRPPAASDPVANVSWSDLDDLDEPPPV